MTTPAHADDVAGGSTPLLADTEALPQAATQWSALLDAPSGVGQQQIHLPVYPDPASAAVAVAMATWPAIHEARIARRNAAARVLVGATDNTSGAFADTDRSGAAAIANSAGPTLV